MGNRRRLLVRGHLFVGIALTLWAAGVCFGFGRLLQYATTPGEQRDPAQRWPSGSSLRPDPERANLVLAAHPRCPCTRASLEELARLMAQAQGRVSAHVLVFRPRHLPANWERTDLWRSAARIPGVSVCADEDGREAGRFGAVTSGHVLLYDRSGRLRFSGGITASRGHIGDNAGRTALLGLLVHGAAGRERTPVFGCELFPEAAPIERGSAR